MADYNPQQVVGEWGEKRVSALFDLVRNDPRDGWNVPDLIARGEPFYVESKASAFNNGGVINKRQLYRFDSLVNMKRFYAFLFHSVTDNMRETFPTQADLLEALDPRSLFLFPFSVVRAHFETSKVRQTPRHDDFVQLNEAQARAIFDKDRETWVRLGLDSGNYEVVSLEGKVHVMTRGTDLRRELRRSFHPENL